MSALLKKALAPFERHFKTPGLIEVIVNQPGEVVLETVNGWKVKKDAAMTLKALVNMAKVLATVSGQEFSPDTTPLLATHLPGYGYRIQVLGAGLVDSKIAISIRVGAARTFDIDSYMDDETAGRLINAVIAGKNVLVAGGTGSGKTTFINSLIKHIPGDVRIVTIEDTKELTVPHRNQVRILKSKSGTDLACISYNDIINACVRIRPDRIIVGEISIDNTMPFLRLLNTGHGGTMATIHADTQEKAIEALILNARLAGAGGEREDIKQYALSAIDVIVHIHKNKQRKFVAEPEFVSV